MSPHRPSPTSLSPFCDTSVSLGRFAHSKSPSSSLSGPDLLRICGLFRRRGQPPRLMTPNTLLRRVPRPEPRRIRGTGHRNRGVRLGEELADWGSLQDCLVVPLRRVRVSGVIANILTDLLMPKKPVPFLHMLCNVQILLRRRWVPQALLITILR